MRPPRNPRKRTTGANLETGESEAEPNAESETASASSEPSPRNAPRTIDIQLKREMRANDAKLAGGRRTLRQLRLEVIEFKALASELMARGNTPRLAAEIMTRDHGIARLTAQRYVAAVLAQLYRDQNAEPKAAKKARIVAGVDKQWRDAVDAGDRSAALKALQLKALLELNSPDLEETAHAKGGAAEMDPRNIG